MANDSIENITERKQEFDLVNQYLEKQIKGRSPKQLKNFHGVKLNRKRPIKVNGKYYQLKHSFILVYDEKVNKVKPFLLTPGKPRDGLESGKLGEGSFGTVKRVQDKEGTEFALKIIDEEKYYKAQLKIIAEQIKKTWANWGFNIKIDENSVPALSRFLAFKAIKKQLILMVKNEFEVLKHAGLRHAVIKRSYTGLGLLKRFILWLFNWNTHKSYILMDLVPGQPLAKMDLEKYNRVQARIFDENPSMTMSELRDKVFVDGTQCVLTKPQINAQQKLALALELAQKIGVIHKKGWALLDIKGENFLFNCTSHGRIEANPIDFGCAEPLGKELGVSGFKGTGSYCSPEMLSLQLILLLQAQGRATKEQLNKKIKVTDKMDVYSFGVVFKYELNLEQDFEGGATALINRMLNQNPDDRPTMDEVCQDLLALQQQRRATNGSSAAADNGCVSRALQTLRTAHGTFAAKVEVAQPMKSSISSSVI